MARAPARSPSPLVGEGRGEGAAPRTAPPKNESRNIGRLASLCVFCGSSAGADPAYAAAARNMGQALARRTITLVYGGGGVGLMGVIAGATLEAGGRVISVIPEALRRRELARLDVTELHVVHSMHARKQLMADLSDGFIALPGGFGTFEEFLEILTWGQLGIHHKPCGLLDVRGYFAGLLAFFDHALQEQFLRPAHRALVLREAEPDALLDLMERYRSPVTEKWLTAETT